MSKSFLFFILLFNASIFTLCQENKHQVFINGNIHRIDYYIGLGYAYSFKQHSIKGSINIGISTNIIQRTLASRNELAYQYDFLKAKKWNLGPSLQYGLIYYPIIQHKNIHWYQDVQFGYTFAYGDKIKLLQSALGGVIFENYKRQNLKAWGSIQAFSFQISLGLAYEW